MKYILHSWCSGGFFTKRKESCEDILPEELKLRFEEWWPQGMLPDSPKTDSLSHQKEGFKLAQEIIAFLGPRHELEFWEEQTTREMIECDDNCGIRTWLLDSDGNCTLLDGRMPLEKYDVRV